MANKAVSVKLSPDELARFAVIAGKRDRSAHYLMREAITEYIAREEFKQSLSEEADEAWRDYKETGEYISLDRAVAWVKSGKTELPTWEK
jgi:predicted transcriptional regulator